LLLGVSSCKQKKTEPWVSLFDGQTLDGWEIKNGNASYTIINEEIIGTTVMDSPNTFLCTTTMYSDFILFRLEVIVFRIIMRVKYMVIK